SASRLAHWSGDGSSTVAQPGWDTVPPVRPTSPDGHRQSCTAKVSARACASLATSSPRTLWTPAARSPRPRRLSGHCSGLRSSPAVPLWYPPAPLSHTARQPRYRPLPDHRAAASSTSHTLLATGSSAAAARQETRGHHRPTVPATPIQNPPRPTRGDRGGGAARPPPWSAV